MKKLLSKVGRAIFIITYIMFIIGTIAFAILFLLKLRQLNDLDSLYSQAQENLNKSSSESKVTINNLQQSFNDLNNEITDLKQQNTDLKTQLDQQSQNGYAEISGKVSGQIILGDNNLSQYQMVCAQNANNVNIQYCITVSSIGQTYTLVLPAGTYQVTARVLDKNNQVALPNYKATYSEYVKCVVEKGADQCDTKLSRSAINVDVKVGSKATNINPIDWNAQ